MSSPSVEEMRYALSTVYPGPKWKNKVSNMSANQVIAVYYDFANRGKFEERSKNNYGKKHNKKPEKKKSLDNGYYYEQMTIDGKWERR